MRSALLLSVALCTETLASGINLPARSVVVTSLVKGPFGKEKLIDPSVAHQIFGRAGRPQFDAEGFVYAFPHEDDVRILRWKQQYEQIPETAKDPVMLKKKKDLLRKKPSRNQQKKYWTESDFERLKGAPPADWINAASIQAFSPTISDGCPVISRTHWPSCCTIGASGSPSNGARSMCVITRDWKRGSSAASRARIASISARRAAIISPGLQPISICSAQYAG